MPVFDPNAGSGPAYTVGYLIDRTFDLLLSASRQNMNRLGVAIDDVEDTIHLDFQPKAMVEGVYIAIDDEVLYVWSSQQASGSSSTATVLRGQKGTTAAPHDAKTIIFVDPHFTRYQVRQTLRDEIRSWGPQVFQVKTKEVPTQRFERGYDLADLGNYYYTLDLLASPDPRSIGRRSGLDWRSVSYRMIPSAPTSDFPSGDALVLTEPGRVRSGSLHLSYAAPIDVDTTFEDADLLTDMGVDRSDVDIPPIGAAWRLAAGREMRRMLFEAQGVAADLQNVPPGYQIAAAEKFKNERDSRLDDAIRRLRAKYPIRRRS